MDAQGLDQARVERRSKYTLTSHPLRWLSILLNVLLTAQIGSYNSISGQSIYGPIAESEALFYPIVVVMLLQSLGYVAVITPRCRTSLRELHTNFLSNSVYTFTNFSTYLEEHPNSALLYWMLAVTSCCLALFNGGFLLIDRLTCKEKVSGRLLSVNVSSVAAQSTSPCFYN